LALLDGPINASSCDPSVSTLFLKQAHLARAGGRGLEDARLHLAGQRAVGLRVVAGWWGRGRCGGESAVKMGAES